MRQSKSQHMVRPTPESDFITRKRDEKARVIAYRLSQREGTTKDAQKLQEMLQEGAVLHFTPEATQTIQAELTRLLGMTDKDKRRHQHGKD